MSDSFKDKANYMRFHEDNKNVKPSKRVTELATLMDLHYTGYRTNNKRKADAKLKVQDRKMRRAREQQELFKMDVEI